MDEVEGKGHQIVAADVEMVATAEGAHDASLQARRRQGRRGLPVLDPAAQSRFGVEIVVSARLG